MPFAPTTPPFINRFPTIIAIDLALLSPALGTRKRFSMICLQTPARRSCYASKVAVLFFGLIGLLVHGQSGSASPPGIDAQIVVPRIDEMPNVPQPLKIRDWRQTALDYDDLVFDLHGHGERPPLIWIDKARRNFDEDAFGLYTSAWEGRGGPNSHGGEFHEAINTIPAVLSATLVGIDKSNQHGRNWVSMCRSYVNRASGWNICANATTPQPGPDGRQAACEFWYHLYPNILFFQLADRYRATPGFDELLRTASDQMYRATRVLKDAPRGFHYSWINFSSMEPIYNGRFEQPDASAGFAWLQYAAYSKFRDPKYLEGADGAMQALVAEPKNPYYECLLPFGAYTAARLNAEQCRNYDVAKLVNWCFAGQTPARGGNWGAVVGRWGEYDVAGLIGASDRVFLMNTFDTASPLVPLVRYDQRFARAIGKWMLNAANAARLFYPDEMPAKYQSAADLKDAVKGLIAYEAISPNRNGQPIFADRDDWGRKPATGFRSSASTARRTPASSVRSSAGPATRRS